MANKTLLLVEDNAISREGMAVIIRSQGYNVVTFGEGREAIDYLLSQPPPDLILLDMMIHHPGWDGWRFLESRKRIPGGDSIPVIITTALGIASDEWADSLGASGLLRKPIEAELLLEEIRKCLAEEPPTACP